MASSFRFPIRFAGVRSGKGLVAGIVRAIVLSGVILAPPSPSCTSQEPFAGKDRSDTPRVEVVTKDAERETTLTYTGRVVDQSGEPVADATVMIDDIKYAQLPMPPQRVTRTDSTGQFEFQIPHEPLPAPNAVRRKPCIWAYKPGYSVRCVRALRQDDLEMVLPDEAPFSVEVRHPDIDRFVDFEVAPLYFHLPNGRYTADQSTGLSGPIPLTLKKMLTQKIEEDGTVEFVGITKPLVSLLEFSSPEIGQQVAAPFHVVELLPCGTLDIKLDCPPEQLPEIVTVSFEIKFDWEPGQFTTAGARYSKRLDRNGRLIIPKAPVGETKLVLSWPYDSEIIPIPPANISIEKNATTTCVIKTIESVELSGRVLLADNNNPVVGGRLAFRTMPDSKVRRFASTDGDGMYRVRMPPGEIKIQLVAMPQSGSHQYPPTSSVVIPKGVEKFEAELITVDPREVVRGFVIDENGKRVENRDVIFLSRQFGMLRAVDRSDERGSFVLKMDRYTADEFLEKLALGQIDRLKVLPVRSQTDKTPITDFIAALDEFPKFKVMSQKPLVLKLLSK